MAVTSQDVEQFRAGFAESARVLDGIGDTTADIGNITDKMLTGHDALVLLTHQAADQIVAVADTLVDQADTETALRDLASKLAATTEVSDDERAMLTGQLDSIGDSIETALETLSRTGETFETKATAEGTQAQVPTSPIPASARISPALERHNVG